MIIPMFAGSIAPRGAIASEVETPTFTESLYIGLYQLYRRNDGDAKPIA